MAASHTINLPLLIVLSVIATVITSFFLPVLYNVYANLCFQCTSPALKRIASLSNITSKSDGSQSNQATTSDLHGFFKHTTLIAITFFFLTSLFVSIDRITSYWITFPMFSILIAVCYFVARMVLSLIFIGRLYYTFKDSVIDKYSDCTVRTLMIIWFLMPVCIVLGIVINRLPIAVPLMLSQAFYILFFVTDIGLCVTLMVMFMKKLKILVDTTRTPWLIRLMVKYTLLYTFCFASSILVLLLTVIFMVADFGVETQERRRLGFVMLSLDCLCNVLAIWLNLSFANGWYRRLCSPCHARTELCFGYSVNESMMIANVTTTSNKTIQGDTGPAFAASSISRSSNEAASAEI